MIDFILETIVGKIDLLKDEDDGFLYLAERAFGHRVYCNDDDGIQEIIDDEELSLTSLCSSVSGYNSDDEFVDYDDFCLTSYSRDYVFDCIVDLVKQGQIEEEDLLDSIEWHDYKQAIAEELSKPDIPVCDIVDYFDKEGLNLYSELSEYIESFNDYVSTLKEKEKIPEYKLYVFNYGMLSIYRLTEEQCKKYKAFIEEGNPKSCEIYFLHANNLSHLLNFDSKFYISSDEISINRIDIEEPKTE